MRKYIFSVLIILLTIVYGETNNKILFEDPLDGSVKNGWSVPLDNIVEHPQYGKIFRLDCIGERLEKSAPQVGDKSWTNYSAEVEILLDNKKGFIGIDFNMQDEENVGCNVHFATWRDVINLQAMGMWGTSKGSWKLWPISQNQMSLEDGKWLKFRIEAGDGFANIYYENKCIYTIYDLPFSNGGIRFWASYHASAYFRNLKVTKMSEKIMPVLDDDWKKYRSLDIITDWRVTELKPTGFAKKELPEYLDKENWIEVPTDVRGVVNLSAIYPNYSKNTVLARTVINSNEAKTNKVFFTYTDRFTLYCNGKEVFHGPDRNWFNPDREKYGNSRLIPDQFEVEIPLQKGENELIIRSEVMEDFGWGFWMRKEY